MSFDAQLFLRRVLAETTKNATELNGGKDTIDGGSWEFGAGNLPFTIGVGVGALLVVLLCAFGCKKLYHHHHPEGTW